MKLNEACKSGQGKTWSLLFTTAKDGRGLWNSLLAHYQSPDRVDALQPRKRVISEHSKLLESRYNDYGYRR